MTSLSMRVSRPVVFTYFIRIVSPSGVTSPTRVRVVAHPSSVPGPHVPPRVVTDSHVEIRLRRASGFVGGTVRTLAEHPRQ